jgi:hypothetical protein
MYWDAGISMSATSSLGMGKTAEVKTPVWWFASI